MKIRISRPRFTVRRLMLAVAIVGVLLGVLVQRANHFRAMAEMYREMLRVSREERRIANSGQPVCPVGSFRELTYWRRAALYTHAARHPWRPDPVPND